MFARAGARLRPARLVKNSISVSQLIYPRFAPAGNPSSPSPLSGLFARTVAFTVAAAAAAHVRPRNGICSHENATEPNRYEPNRSDTNGLPKALHRRLLDQLARMRAELPPVCRLAAANSPLNRPTPRHRALAEMEDKLHCLVSGESLARLAPVLADPLLKLDEVSSFPLSPLSPLLSPSCGISRRRPRQQSFPARRLAGRDESCPRRQRQCDRGASHPFNRVVITLCAPPYLPGLYLAAAAGSLAGAGSPAS